MPEPCLDLGDVGSCESALVAAVARRECTQRPFTSVLTLVSTPYFRTMLW